MGKYKKQNKKLRKEILKQIDSIAAALLTAYLYRESNYDARANLKDFRFSLKQFNVLYSINERDSSLYIEIAEIGVMYDFSDPTEIKAKIFD